MTFNLKKIPSPNRDEREIPVEFLVLHHTSVNIQRTLDIFLNPDLGVSAHMVIDRDGTVYEMVDCLEGRVLRGRHAGVSQWQEWESFNDFSIGIELINYNGNVFEYSQEQYDSLQKLVGQLKQYYPALRDPERVLGHEHIAGHRGKIDPGVFFDWSRFYADNYPNQPVPVRKAAGSPELIQSLRAMVSRNPEEESLRNTFWESASLMAESWQKAGYTNTTFYTHRL